jgi:hypothetical protein
VRKLISSHVGMVSISTRSAFKMQFFQIIKLLTLSLQSDQSHVDYLSQIDNGVCSPTHPVLLPHVFIEVLYSVANINQDGGKFVFANGDETGYGFHGEHL